MCTHVHSYTKLSRLIYAGSADSLGRFPYTLAKLLCSSVHEEVIEFAEAQNEISTED